MIAWRWRRVLRYELGAIRERADEAVAEWAERQRKARAKAQEDARLFGKPEPPPWEPTEDLKADLDSQEKRLAAVSQADPLANPSEELVWVVAEAAEDLKLPVKRLLGFKGSGEWWEFAPFDGWLATEAGRAGLARLFEALCKAREMTAEETWGWLRRRAELDRDKARQAYERRLWEEERVRLLVALPREEALERVLRYEAHLSRLFARTLEELERVRGLTRRERLRVIGREFR